uniref:Uncharacterized protein n=1 Tax=Acrobeloides nanus TaxID=290746 RepID=A0A914D475_9BILA
MIKTMNKRAKNDLDSLLKKSREFLKSQKILASLNGLKRVSNDDQRIRCNSRNFKNGKKTSQTQPPKKTPFRIHIENLVYPDQESGPSSSSR